MLSIFSRPGCICERDDVQVQDAPSELEKGENKLLKQHWGGEGDASDRVKRG